MTQLPDEDHELIVAIAREYTWRYALPSGPIVEAWRAARRRRRRGPVLARLRLPRPYDLNALAQVAADLAARRQAEPGYPNM